MYMFHLFFVSVSKKEQSEFLRIFFRNDKKETSQIFKKNSTLNWSKCPYCWRHVRHRSFFLRCVEENKRNRCLFPDNKKCVFLSVQISAKIFVSRLKCGRHFIRIIFCSYCCSLIELDWYLTSNFSGLRNCTRSANNCIGSSNFVQTKLNSVCFVLGGERRTKNGMYCIFTKFFNYLMLTFVCRKPSVRCVRVSKQVMRLLYGRFTFPQFSAQNYCNWLTLLFPWKLNLTRSEYGKMLVPPSDRSEI